MNTTFLRVAMPALLLAGLSAGAVTLYVDVNSTNPVPPYTNWASAANVIQDAVDAASAGDTLLVTNGVYATGGKAVYGTMTNRVAVDKPLALLSVNGPDSTVIEGAKAAGGGNGEDAIRCVYLTNDASLSGFTLTNGATRNAGSITFEQSGGGLFCESTNSVATNCLIVVNHAQRNGGAALSGTLSHCTLSNNITIQSPFTSSTAVFCILVGCTVVNNDGSGASYSTLDDCTLSRNDGIGVLNSTLSNCFVSDHPLGGAYDSTVSGCVLQANTNRVGAGAWRCVLNDCILKENVAAGGAGARESTLTNCLVIGNSADSLDSGGGVSASTLHGCLVVGNSAGKGGGMSGGTAYYCTLVGNSADSTGGGSWNADLRNCVVYFNAAPDGSNSYNTYTGLLNYTCTTPLPPTGIGNITNAPLFVDTNDWADLRLQSNSPCINAGNNAYVTTTNDLDGNPRIVGGTVDMGAYEFQSPQSAISYAWLQQYGLPTDGSVDHADGDNDRATTWQEWKGWTDPTNALSVLRMLNPEPGTNGTLVSWQSVPGHSYQLNRAIRAEGPFSVLQSNVVGQVGTTSVSDTNAVGDGPFFYRVGVPAE